MPIDVDGLRVNYNDAGSGLPIIFIPGLVGSKEWFRYQTSGLSDSYRVISYDLRRARGHVDYSLDLLVNDLVKFLGTLRILGGVIAGYDLGALIAMRFALTHPEKCLGLALVSAAPSFSTISEENLFGSFTPGSIELESFFRRIWKRIFMKKMSQDEDLGSLEYLTRHSADLDAATLAARMQIMRSTDLTDDLPEIGTPTLIVAGSKDHPQVLAGSQTLDERIADSALEVLENADHFLFYTRHDFFNAAIDEYLRHNVANF